MERSGLVFRCRHLTPTFQWLLAGQQRTGLSSASKESAKGFYLALLLECSIWILCLFVIKLRFAVGFGRRPVLKVACDDHCSGFLFIITELVQIKMKRNCRFSPAQRWAGLIRWFAMESSICTQCENFFAYDIRDSKPY